MAVIPQRAWQRMLSGRRLDLLDPSPLDIELEDIAHGLARVARWNGQTIGEHIYSVAQHSLLVERIIGLLRPDASQTLRLCALLHDAPEYVIGDMISPFKSVIGEVYTSVEARLMAAINLHFQLPAKPRADTKRLVKQADQQAAFFEATHLAGFATAEAKKYFGAPLIGPNNIADLLIPMPITKVQKLFLERSSELMG